MQINLANLINFLYPSISVMQHADLPLLDPLGGVDLMHRDLRGRAAIKGQAVPEGDEGRGIRVRRGDRGERGVQHKWMSRLLSVDGVE